MPDPAKSQPVTRPNADRKLSGPCPNCSDPTESNYCPNCGQRRVHRRISLRRMLLEVLEDQFALNAALPRTIGALMLRPGLLSAEYLDGRVERYIPPFRLYLAASVLFFLLLTFFVRDVQIDVMAAGAAPAEGPYMWGSDRSFQTGWEQLDTLLTNRYNHFRRMPPEQALAAFRGEAIQRLPTAVFLLLPVFALILKLINIRLKRYYVEHFVFGLHTHAYTFLLFTVMLLGQTSWIRVPATLWMLLYLYLAMKRFYGQGHLKTFVKCTVVLGTYSIAIGFGIAGLLAATLLLA